MSKDIRLAIQDCERQIMKLRKYEEEINKLQRTIYELKMNCKHPEAYIQGSEEHYHTKRVYKSYKCPDCGWIWEYESK